MVIYFEINSLFIKRRKKVHLKGEYKYYININTQPSKLINCTSYCRENKKKILKEKKRVEK